MQNIKNEIYFIHLKVIPSPLNLISQCKISFVYPLTSFKISPIIRIRRSNAVSISATKAEYYRTMIVNKSHSALAIHIYDSS